MEVHHTFAGRVDRRRTDAGRSDAGRFGPAPVDTDRTDASTAARPFRSVGSSRLRAPRMKAVDRPRVDTLLDQAWDHRVTLVLAPPGSGKTTALAAFAGRSQRPVAWLTCNGIDSAESLCAHLQAALRGALPELAGQPASIEQIVSALDASPEPIAVVIDDVHALVGTPAETVVGIVIDDAPESLRIVLGGRREPGIDLGPLKLRGQVLQIGTEDLRFRAWEAEQLFRDLYDTWLRPDDIARLARRVDGWAAGLQLFHLAARGLNPVEQRKLIDRLNGRARIVREYLVANVLEPLSDELRTFLVDTCVVSVVTPDLADELRGSTDSDRHLRELANTQLFTVAIDDESYRYHEVLRAQLEVILLERDGSDGVAARHRLAAQLLERRGHVGEAVHCYARAADWADVRRLAGDTTDSLDPPTTAWLSDLPAAVVADDPWLILARARAEMLAGRWNDAIGSLRSAATKGLGVGFADRCRPQLAAITAWLDPLALPPDGWIGVARAGTGRDPLGAARRLERAAMGGSSVAAAAALRLVAGDLAGAQQVAEDTIGDDAVGPYGVATGLAVVAFAALLSGDRDGEATLDEADGHAERAGFGWLSRMLRAGLALTDRASGVEQAARVREQCVADGDPWGASIAALLAGLGAARRGLPAIDHFERAAQGFRSLQAKAFEAVTMLALATCDGADVDDAERRARTTGTTGMAAWIEEFVCGASPLPTRSSTAGGLAKARPTVAPEPTVAPAPTAPLSFEVHCLGRFHVSVAGNVVDLRSLRPRARMLLKLLAINPGVGVHRELIVETLWPDGSAESGIRNLQVAVSSVRTTLAANGLADTLGILRDGEAYRLVVPTIEASDLAHFLHLVAGAKAAASRDEHDEAMRAAQVALALHHGELLVEDGPVEFVVRERARVAAIHQAAAAIVAAGHVRTGDHAAAIDVCETAILEHPYSDELWRLLVLAHRERGDLAAAELANARYEKVLDELRS